MALSADGRYVVFTSEAEDLVPGQVETHLGLSDVFLFDRLTSGITLVSRTSFSATTASSSGAFEPVMSADGRFVAFVSASTDLVVGQSDMNGGLDVFLYDRDTGTTALVSHSAGGATTAADGSSFQPSITADGAYVAFRSVATNLVAGQVEGGPTPSDVFLYDRIAGTTMLVSALPGAPANAAGGVSAAAVSADGSRIAFASDAANQVPGQVEQNSESDIFLFDRASTTVTLVSRASGAANTTGSGKSFEPAISANGAQVAYRSSADDLVAGASASFSTQVFVFNAATGTNSLVSHASSSPLTPSEGQHQKLALAADGSRIAFVSTAQDLVTGQVDGLGTLDLFVYEHAGGAVTLASHAHTSAATAATPSPSHQPSVSGDGGVIVYASFATDLEAGLVDTNADSDIFAFSPGDGTNTALTRHAPGLLPTTPLGGSFFWTAPGISLDGRFVTFNHLGGPFLVGETGIGGVYLVDRELETTTLVSYDSSSPLVRGNDFSGLMSISDDGRWISFSSAATNLVSGFTHTNGIFDDDVFLFDRDTGAVTLVSHSASSVTTTGNGHSGPASISGDGRFLVFGSFARDLVAGQSDANLASDVFLFDRTTGGNVLVSHSATSSTTVGSGESRLPVISRDGNCVAFTSTAGNLLASDPTGPGLYLYDRALDTNILVSRSASDPAASVGGVLPALSADGRFVAFSSLAANLVPGQVDTNGSHDVFLFDRQTGAMALVSHLPGAPSSTSPTNDHFGPIPAAISRDGRFVAFASLATDLVPGQSDTNDLDDVFLFDRLTGAVTLVSHKFGQPTAAGDRGSSAPSLSADGAFVAFQSDADDLLAQPIGSLALQVYLYERGTGRAKLASRALASEHLPGDGPSVFPQISADGRHVLFGGHAENLVENDFNDTTDVFVFTDLPKGRDFFTLTPCRLFDSRDPGAGGAFVSGFKELVPVHGVCGVPATAAAVSLNVTVTQPTGPGHLTLFAGDAPEPGTSTINFGPGQTRANNAVLPLAADGTLAVLPFVLGGGSVHVLVDVNGWFE